MPKFDGSTAPIVTMQPVEREYTVTETAAVAGLDRATVRSYAEQGKLRGARRIGRGSWHIPASTVANLVQYVQSNHAVRLYGEPLTGRDADVIELGVRIESAVHQARGRVFGDAA